MSGVSTNLVSTNLVSEKASVAESDHLRLHEVKTLKRLPGVVIERRMVAVAVVLVVVMVVVVIVVVAKGKSINVLE